MIYKPADVTVVTQGTVKHRDVVKVEGEFANVIVLLERGRHPVRIHGTGNRNGKPFVQLVSASGNKEEIATFLEFPEFADRWDIFAADIMFDDLRVIFWRP